MMNANDERQWAMQVNLNAYTDYLVGCLDRQLLAALLEIQLACGDVRWEAQQVEQKYRPGGKFPALTRLVGSFSKVYGLVSELSIQVARYNDAISVLPMLQFAARVQRDDQVWYELSVTRSNRQDIENAILRFFADTAALYPEMKRTAIKEELVLRLQMLANCPARDKNHPPKIGNEVYSVIEFCAEEKEQQQ